MLPQLQQIAAQAAADSDRVFTNRAHRIEKEWLRQAYELTRKDGAVGVDGQDGKAYGEKPSSYPRRPPPTAEGM
jgi:RNA-directed DNA polymerase